MAPINGDKNLFFALSLTSSFSRERRQFALIVVELPLPCVVNRSFVPRYFPLALPPGYNSLEINPKRGNSLASMESVSPRHEN